MEGNPYHWYHLAKGGVELLKRYGGVLGFVGLFIGGLATHPDCRKDVVTGLYRCTSFLGYGTWTQQPVPLSQIGKVPLTTYPWGVVIGRTLTGAIVGALIGVAAAWIAIKVFHQSKEDMGIED